MITFKPRGFFGKNKNEVEAEIKDALGKLAYTMHGNFTESIVLKDLDEKETVLYEAPKNMYPTDCKKYFNLNYFAI